MKHVKDPVTHDYLRYGALTMVLAVLVVAAHYFYGDFGVVERYLSVVFESLQRIEPWKVMVAAVIIIALVAAELIRENRYSSRH